MSLGHLTASPTPSSRTNVIWFALARILSKASAIILLPVYTRVLAPGELGMAVTALAATGMLSLIVAPGIESVYLRCVYRAREDRPAVGTVTWMHLGMISAGLAVCILAGHTVAALLLPGIAVWPFYVLIVINTALASCAAPVRARWRARGLADRVAAMEVAQSLVAVSTVLLGLFVLRWGAVSLVAAETVAHLVLVPASLSHLAANARSGWNTAFARTAMPLAMSGLPLAGSITVLSSMDRVLLNRLDGPAAVALYGTAYQIAAAIMFVIVIVDKEWEAVVFDVTRVRGAAPGSPVLQRLWTLSLSLFLSLASVVALFGSDIVEWLLGPRYANSAQLIPWIAVVAILKVPFSFMVHLARALDRAASVIAGALLATGVFIGANLLLIPVLGGLGAAWAGIAAYACACLFWASRPWNCFRFEPPLAVSVAMAGGAVIVASVMGGTAVSRIAGIAATALLIFRTIGYWKFLGQIRPTGVQVTTGAVRLASTI